MRLPMKVLHVISHTDIIGSDEYNYILSLQRAQAVAQYLNHKSVSLNQTLH